MHPVLFRIGGFTINWYGVLMALGFGAGLWNWTRLGRREGRDYAFCADFLFWVMAAGLIGARTAYVLANLGEFRDEPWTVFFIHRGGLVFYGGFLAAVPAVAVFAKRRGERPLALMDFAVTSVPLAHALGRVGCFINGCCFGGIHRGLLSVRYPDGSYPLWYHMSLGLVGREERWSLPVHPVQLYEAAFDLALYALLVLVYRRRTRDGRVGALYLLVYPAGRFALEFLRGDERIRWMGLTVAQLVCLGLWAAGAALWAAGRRAREANRHG
jgi:phosphatidylglycerol:prolipoprotein diacylglycerol transferase